MWPKSNWELKAKNWNETGILFMKVTSTTADTFCSRDYCANAIACEKAGTGMRSEPPNIAWIGDHLCSRRSNIGRLQTKEVFVFSSNYFTARLSSKTSRLKPPWVIEENTVLRTSRPLIDRFLVPQLGNQSSRTAAPRDQQTVSNLLVVKKIVTRQMSDHVEPSEFFDPFNLFSNLGMAKKLCWTNWLSLFSRQWIKSR